MAEEVSIIKKRGMEQWHAHEEPTVKRIHLEPREKYVAPTKSDYYEAMAKQPVYKQRIEKENRFAEMQEEGMTPQEAREVLRKEAPIEKYYEVKEQLRKGVKTLKCGKTDAVKSAIGKALTPKTYTPNEIRRQKEIEEAQHQGRLKTIRSRVSTVAPARIQYRQPPRPIRKPIMRAKPMSEMTKEDAFGMSSIFVSGGSNPVGNFGSIGTPMGNMNFGNVKPPIGKIGNRKVKKVKQENASDVLGLRGFW